MGKRGSKGTAQRRARRNRRNKGLGPWEAMPAWAHGRDTEKLSPELASAICEDLPDGAYYAMMEELTGMDGADAIMALPDYEED